MRSAIIVLSFATVGLTAPLAAQGHSGKHTRTYIDAQGRECRETAHLKGNGDESYQVKCKRAKGEKGWNREHGDDDEDNDRGDDDDRGRDGRHENGRYDDSRRGDGRYDNGRYGNGQYGTNGNCLDTRARGCTTAQTSSYPTTLPEMAAAVIWGRGQRTNSATSWLGRNDYRVRYVDRNGDGRPDTATWFGSNGRMVQQWIDRNNDGRADAVRIYRDGRLVRQLGN